MGISAGNDGLAVVGVQPEEAELADTKRLSGGGAGGAEGVTAAA